MNIVVLSTGKKSDIVRLAAIFYAAFLKIKTKKTITIQLQKGVLAEGGNGVTGIEGDLIMIAIDSSLKHNELIRTLAHEMVHAKQLADGRLIFPDTWCGKRMNVSYLKRPWEIDALSKQELMARHFLEFLVEIRGD